MICAYCGRDKKGSKEHIISSGVLDIFPECFITKDNIRINSIKDLKILFLFIDHFL